MEKVSLSSQDLKWILSLIEEKPVETFDIQVLKEVLELSKKHHRAPLVILPELFKGMLNLKSTLSIDFSILKHLLNNEYGFDLEIKPGKEKVVPIATPGIVAENLPEVDSTTSYLLELEPLLGLIKLLNKGFPYGIYICTEFMAKYNLGWLKGFYNHKTFPIDDNKVLIILTQKENLTPDDFIVQLVSKLTGHKKPFSFKQIPVEVIYSPLSKQTPPMIELPSTFEHSKGIKKVGMRELRPIFIFKKDLEQSQKVESEDEIKLILSSIEKENDFKSPVLRKGDILVPIKRLGNSNVALICEELPTQLNFHSEIFIPKGDIAIIRLDPDVFTFNESKNFATILMAELRNFSGDRILNVQLLRKITYEFFSEDVLVDILKDKDFEIVLKAGREVIKEKLTKYLTKNRKIEIEFYLYGDFNEKDIEF
ncbi:hypothetical protein [Thermovibrio sp.]